MNSNARAVMARIGLVILCSLAGYLLLQQPVRRLETEASAGLVRLWGSDRVFLVSDASILVLPAGREPFRAIVTPSCSAMSSVLAIACLAFASGRRAGRGVMALALVLSLSAIVVGNVVRIAASVGVGLLAGRAALVLFHDWVGSTFAFAYTLGGYVLMLYILLPSHPDREQARVHLA